MTSVLRARGLGKTYRRRAALSDCTLDLPAGQVIGLVGPNGAGKTTLGNLAVGLLTPTTGTIEVLGGRPGAGPAQLAKVGFVAQDAPTHARMSVEDHLRLGAHLNPSWDDRLARDRIRRLGLDPAHRAGNISGGQRAQLALTLGVAKRPELLLLDEPVASLDPLARREFLQDPAQRRAGGRRAHREVAHRGDGVAEQRDPAHPARFARDALRARLARRLVGGQRRRDVRLVAQRRRQRGAVLDRLAAALAEVGQHRVDGVAEQHEPARDATWAGAAGRAAACG